MYRDYYFCRDCNIWVLREPQWTDEALARFVNGHLPRTDALKQDNLVISPEEDRDIRNLIKDSRSKAETVLLLAGYMRMRTPSLIEIVDGQKRICVPELRHRFRHLRTQPEWIKKEKRDLMVTIIKDEVNRALRRRVS